jgi:hypothetical protein
MTRRRGHNPLALFVVLLVLAAVLNAVALIERLAPLLLLAAVGLVVWALARRGRSLLPRPPKVIDGQAEDSELERLRAEVIWLRRRLAETTYAAHAAWEQASEPGGQDATVVDLRTRLLRDARSGARPL